MAVEPGQVIRFPRTKISKSITNVNGHFSNKFGGAEYFKTGAYRVLQLPFLVFVSPANPAWQQVSESATKPIWRHGHLIESKHNYEGTVAYYVYQLNK